MSEKYTFAILGGDRRQATVAKRLISRGHAVRIFGLGDLSLEILGAELYSSPVKTVLNCDVVLLPLPVTRDGRFLNFVSLEKKDCPTLTDILKYINNQSKTIILGGLIPIELKNKAAENGIEAIDYYDSELLQKKNALPSAEGAIMIAMENTDKVLEGMPVLISGYGRIARILAEKLKKLGANVYVSARRDEVLCEITMSGYTPVSTNDTQSMKKAVEECDVIFNTVPGIIFTRQILEGVLKKPIYIEIASSPGGIDISAARDLGYHIIFAPSLPGKYAPQTAGEYIFETISDILESRGMRI